MKRKTVTAAAAAGVTPSIVLRAFAPDTEFVLTLDGYLLLEALGCAFLRGQFPGMRDIMLAALVMTDCPAVQKAHRQKRVDALLGEAYAGKKPGDILALADAVRTALEDALAPTDDGGVEREKKHSSASAGG